MIPTAVMVVNSVESEDSNTDSISGTVAVDGNRTRTRERHKSCLWRRTRTQLVVEAAVHVVVQAVTCTRTNTLLVEGVQ